MNEVQFFLIICLLDIRFKLIVHNIYSFFYWIFVADMMHCLDPPSRLKDLLPQLLQVLLANDFSTVILLELLQVKRVTSPTVRSLLRLGHIQSQALLSKFKNSLKGHPRFRAVYTVRLFYKKEY